MGSSYVSTNKISKLSREQPSQQKRIFYINTFQTWYRINGFYGSLTLLGNFSYGFYGSQEPEDAKVL